MLIAGLLSGVLFLNAAAIDDAPNVAATFSKVEIYIQSTDFLFDPVKDVFSKPELALLTKHRIRLSEMIQAALGSAHSVGGARLTAHLKLYENVPALGVKLFLPTVTYGWEGPGYDSEEDYLTDNQFVHHSVYLQAIEETTGKPIYQIVEPTEREKQVLLGHLEDSTSQYYHWAKWLARKLQIEKPLQ